MLSKEEFIDFILNGPDVTDKATESSGSALPEGISGFDDQPSHASPDDRRSTFARRLLEAADFGYAEMVHRDTLVRCSGEGVGKRLPERVSFWPKAGTRPYQTLLFETDLSHKDLLAIPAFKGRSMAHLDIVEDALARLVSEALEGFQRGGEGVTADVRKGRKDETLCVVSIQDEREGTPMRLVCFGTCNKVTGGLETFHLTEQARSWDRQLAREHLGLLFERQFRKLAGPDWQEAFTTTEERRLADELLDTCTRKAPRESDIQEAVLDLLDVIAKGFGLRKPPNRRRLQAFSLPPDHDIGIDPEERERSFGGKNPFGGVTLRDERSRLLGYIVYPLNTKADAGRLRKHLEQNNRFHNVLVVYPDKDQASVELWQGHEQLKGKLRKGQGHKDAAEVVNLLSRFFVVSKARVRNPTELAQELAYRARYLRRLAVRQLQDEPEKGPLRNLYNAFKEALVHDQTEDEFADAFAQTITYGLLTARWIGQEQSVGGGERLTRRTALKHLPVTSPFLNELFTTALSMKMDEQRGRLLWLVDDIADLLDRVDVAYVFGAGDVGADAATDPVIHFYEPFLAAYDRELKNKRGVFFTPRPVVSYIVRSVHEALRTELGMEDGLASTETWADLAKRISGLAMPAGVKATDPFVCVLDPAAGTGTFLCECIEVIEHTMRARWCRELSRQDPDDPAVQTRWAAYVQQHLLPRMYGFELMMAPYAVAQLKVALRLRQSGYRLSPNDRVRVFLTNSLEGASDCVQGSIAGLFPGLAQQAREVKDVKESKRFTVILGNPPYSLMSANLGVEQRRLVDAYRSVDGARLKERGALQLEKNLQDDYVKFMRVAQVACERSPLSTMGFITNHSYLENPTLRGLRRSFMGTFAHLWILDLHGNTKRKERCPLPEQDQNVFDIQQGVAVIIGARKLDAPGSCVVQWGELWGNRERKYRVLSNWSEGTALSRARVRPTPPAYLFVAQDGELKDEFGHFFPLDGIFPTYSTGIATARDGLTVHVTRSELRAVLRDFASLGAETLRERYALGPDTNDWKVSLASKDVRDTGCSERLERSYQYRPFDRRLTYYTGHPRGFLCNPRWPVMQHLLAGRNLALCTVKSIETGHDYAHVFVTNVLADHHCVSLKEVNYVFPVLLYQGTTQGAGALQRGLFGAEAAGAELNVSAGFLAQIEEHAGVVVVPEAETSVPGRMSGFSLAGYIYCILNSPTYRQRYGAFLRKEFARIPIPRSRQLLLELASLGSKLIGLHLMESHGKGHQSSGVVGDCTSTPVDRATWSDGTIWLDSEHTSGFRGVTEEVWGYHIGGYQVCQKWLKDRKGRALSKTECDHYQEVLVALSESVRLAKTIDSVIGRHGGWPGAFVGSPVPTSV